MRAVRSGANPLSDDHYGREVPDGQSGAYLWGETLMAPTRGAISGADRAADLGTALLE
jgi:hypothetical protein